MNKQLANLGCTHLRTSYAASSKRLQNGLNIQPMFLSSTFLPLTKQDELNKQKYTKLIQEYLSKKNESIPISELADYLGLDLFQTKGILELMKNERIIRLD